MHVGVMQRMKKGCCHIYLRMKMRAWEIPSAVTDCERRAVLTCVRMDHA